MSFGLSEHHSLHCSPALSCSTVLWQAIKGGCGDGGGGGGQMADAAADAAGIFCRRVGVGSLGEGVGGRRKLDVLHA